MDVILRLLCFASVFVGLGEGVYGIVHVSLISHSATDKDLCLCVRVALGKLMRSNTGLPRKGFGSKEYYRKECNNRMLTEGLEVFD